MSDPGEEPLEEWAARRERRRAAEREVPGRRRVVPLSGGAQGSHVAPGAPRLLLEWDGTAWVGVGVAADAAAAREFLGHPPAPEPEAAPETRDLPHPGLGPVFRITPASRGLARTSAALSSLADAPRRLPPPPCSCTHQTPLDPARRRKRLAAGLIRKTGPRAGSGASP
ncbi:DUF6087 family protein [Streptomyces sp. NPDC096205]|uniref:DUF6087 family protein n=1 Tax=Streptomyces sp. NPDC096205 TaxID=3366081 RepID=UPI00380B79A8